jgi:sugar phosphate isomerase/epimerase
LQSGIGVIEKSAAMSASISKGIVMMHSRKDRVRTALAGLPLATAALAEKGPGAGGPQIGNQLFSFRYLVQNLDVIIKGMTDVGLNSCELWSPILEPLILPPFYGNPGQPTPTPALEQAREELRKWRMTVSMNVFKEAYKKFTDAGIDIYAYNCTFNQSFTDGEIERAFDMAEALGVKLITASATLAVAKRVVPFAEKRKLRVAVHNYSIADSPDEFCGPESLAAALKLSNYIWLAFDIGYFTSAGHDPVAYIREHHDRIALIRLKDKPVERGSVARYSARSGSTVQWGWGSTPIKEVLQLLKREKYPIPAMIEYEYEGERGPVGEVKRCYDYAKATLA